MERCGFFTFDFHSGTYPTDHSQVAFVLTLLVRARAWVTVFYESNSPVCNSFQSLSAKMMKVFAPTISGRTTANKLYQLCQGNQSVVDYAIQFCTLAGENRLC